MTRRVSDEQLHRTVAAFLLDRRAEFVADAISAHEAAARRGSAPQPRAGIGRRGTLILLVALLAALLAGAAAIVGSRLAKDAAPPSTGLFTPTGSMSITRTGHTAMLLADGRVVVVGGRGAAEPGGDAVDLRSAEVWDPRSGRFELLPFLTDDRAERVGYSATMLPDQRVLVAGGTESEALLWDPVTGSLEPAGLLSTPRGYHTATLLPDGRVFLVGGFGLQDGEPTELAEAEVWDPAGRRFTPVGSLAAVREPESATLLRDGRVLVIGRGPETDLAEVWDPGTGTFEPAGSLSEGHPEDTATLLPDGRVLVIGGMATFPIEIWDPLTASFTIVGRLDAETGGHTATLLPDGSILMSGGYDMRLKWSYDTALLGRPPWESFMPSAGMSEARTGHTATLLPGGRVLVVGGSAGRGRMDERGNLNRGPSRQDAILRSAETWSP